MHVRLGIAAFSPMKLLGQQATKMVVFVCIDRLVMLLLDGGCTWTTILVLPVDRLPRFIRFSATESGRRGQDYLAHLLLVDGNAYGRMV